MVDLSTRLQWSTKIREAQQAPALLKDDIPHNNHWCDAREHEPVASKEDKRPFRSHRVHCAIPHAAEGLLAHASLVPCDHDISWHLRATDNVGNGWGEREGPLLTKRTGRPEEVNGEGGRPAVSWRQNHSGWRRPGAALGRRSSSR